MHFLMSDNSSISKKQQFLSNYLSKWVGLLPNECVEFIPNSRHVTKHFSMQCSTSMVVYSLGENEANVWDIPIPPM